MRIPKLVCLAIFAEDVREETGGTFTIVGVLPDNLAFEGGGEGEAAMMPKLAVYVRTSIDNSAGPFSDLQVEFRAPSGATVFGNPISAAFIEEKVADASLQGTPVTTIITSMISSPFPILETGRFTVIAKYDGEEIYCGSINIKGPPSDS